MSTDFGKCRICIEVAEVVKMQEEIYRKISDISGVKFTNEEHIPNKMCHKCMSDLEIAYNFRVQCQIAEKHYRTVLPSFEIMVMDDDVPLSKLSKETTVKKKKVKVDRDDEADTDFDKEPLLNDDISVESQSIKTEQNMSELNLIVLRKRSKVSKKNIEPSKDNGKGFAVLKPPKDKQNIAPKAQLICDICGNKFKRRQHFLLHIRRHTSNKPFECELCKKKFYTNSELTRHMRSHTGDKPFGCQFCHRKFSDHSTKIKHERTHTNHRPFVCGQCGKAFTNSYILKNHILSHTGEKKFKCHICQRSFQRESHVKTHYKSLMHQTNLSKNSFNSE